MQNSNVSDDNKSLYIVIAVLISVAVIVSPVLYVYLHYPRYFVRGDIVCQVEAAINLFTMDKLSCVQQLPYDLSKSVAAYVYMSTWPPGFSYAIYLLLKAGLTVSSALKLFELFVWSMGILGWGWLGLKFIEISYLYWIFMCVVATTSLPFFYFLPSSVCLWALMPYWVCLLLKLHDVNGEKVSFVYCLTLGLIASVAILFRYQAIVLILCGIVCIILITRDDKSSSYLKGITYAVLPTLTYGLISWGNFIEKGYPAPMRIEHLDPTWGYLWFIYPFKYVAIDLLRIDSVLKRLFNYNLVMMDMGNVSIHIEPVSVVNFVLTCIIILFSIIVFIKLWKKSNFPRSLVLIFLVAFFTLSIFLMFAGFLAGRDSQPLFRERHFFYLQPLYLLVIIMFFNHFYKRYFISLISNTIIAFIIFSVLLCASISYAKTINTLRYDYILKTQIESVVSQISGGQPDAGIRIISPDFSGMLLDFNKQTIVYNNNYDNMLWNYYYFSKPTWLFVVSSADRLHNFHETANKLFMQSQIVGSVTIYYRLFPIGKIKI